MLPGDTVYLTRDILTSRDESIAIHLPKGTALEYRRTLPDSKLIIVLYRNQGRRILFDVRAHEISEISE